MVVSLETKNQEHVLEKSLLEEDLRNTREKSEDALHEVERLAASLEDDRDLRVSRRCFPRFIPYPYILRLTAIIVVRHA